MAPIKKYRNSAFIRFYKIIGIKTPVYDYLPIGGNKFKQFISFLHTNIQQIIGNNKPLWFLIKVFKGKAADK